MQYDDILKSPAHHHQNIHWLYKINIWQELFWTWLKCEIFVHRRTWIWWHRCRNSQQRVAATFNHHQRISPILYAKWTIAERNPTYIFSNINDAKYAFLTSLAWKNYFRDTATHTQVQMPSSKAFCDTTPVNSIISNAAQRIKLVFKLNHQ